MESIGRNYPEPDEPSGLMISGATDKTVQERRAEFHADFDRAALEDDGECLSSEEILSLQSGISLDPVALEHLAHCRFCASLRQAGWA